MGRSEISWVTTGSSIGPRTLVGAGPLACRSDVDDDGEVSPGVLAGLRRSAPPTLPRTCSRPPTSARGNDFPHRVGPAPAPAQLGHGARGQRGGRGAGGGWTCGQAGGCGWYPIGGATWGVTVGAQNGLVAS